MTESDTMELLAREAGKHGYTKMAVVCGASLLRLKLEEFEEKHGRALREGSK